MDEALTGLESVNTVFGPFLHDPLAGIARALREAIIGPTPDFDVPTGKVIQGEIVHDYD